MGGLARFVVPRIKHATTQRGNAQQAAIFCDDDFKLYGDVPQEHSAAPLIGPAPLAQ